MRPFLYDFIANSLVKNYKGISFASLLIVITACSAPWLDQTNCAVSFMFARNENANLSSHPMNSKNTKKQKKKNQKKKTQSLAFPKTIAEALEGDFKRGLAKLIQTRPCWGQKREGSKFKVVELGKKTRFAIGLAIVGAATATTKLPRLCSVEGLIQTMENVCGHSTALIAGHRKLLFSKTQPVE